MHPGPSREVGALVTKVASSTHPSTSWTRTCCASQSLLKLFPRWKIGWYHVDMSYARSIHEKSCQYSQNRSNHDMTGPSHVKPVCRSMFIKPETVFTNQKSLPKDHFNNGLGSQGQATQYMDVSHLVNQQGQSHDPAKLEHVSKTNLCGRVTSWSMLSAVGPGLAVYSLTARSLHLSIWRLVSYGTRKFERATTSKLDASSR